jgi:predicted O-methyltransferase YrrM
MLELNPNLEQYIIDHIDNEDPVLAELYRETNLKVLRPRMISGHIQGKFLEMLCKMIQPKNILEIGTYTGYSSICLAKGLKKDSQLHTIEINDELEPLIRKYHKKAKVDQYITLHIGNAVEIIPSIEVNFDLVFIDGDKVQYIDYYNAVFNKVNIGGYILADNILWSGKVLEKPASNDYQTKAVIEFNKFIKKDKRVEKTILPFRDGLMLLRKK